jgi:hypothetical protein
MHALSSALLALASVAICSRLLAQEPPAPQHATVEEKTPAVLKLQEVDFFYRSSVAPLSCSGLQARVASIFRALGARDDVQVRVSNCESFVDDQPGNVLDVGDDEGGFSSNRWRGAPSLIGERSRRREQSSHVRVRLMMPTEVTPGVLEELDRDRARRDLVSRVTGNPAAGLNDPIVFPAQRQQVKLSRKTIDLRPEDCELMDQLASQAFPRLGIRVVKRGRSCDRDRISRLPVEVVVEALMPWFPEGPKLAPEGSQPDPAPAAPAPTDSQSSEPKQDPPRQ